MVLVVSLEVSDDVAVTPLQLSRAPRTVYMAFSVSIHALDVTVFLDFMHVSFTISL